MDKRFFISNSNCLALQRITSYWKAQHNAMKNDRFSVLTSRRQFFLLMKLKDAVGKIVTDTATRVSRAAM